MYYLFLLLSVVLLLLQFAVNKFYQKENGNEISVSLLYTCLAGFSASLFFLIINRFNVSVTGFSLLCAAGVSVLCLLYTLLGFYIFSIGSFSLYMMFLMLGGMILPFIYGTVFLNDYAELSVASLVARFTGVLLMTLALIIPTTGNSKTFHKKKGKLSILLYICVFLMNGFVSVISKLHQIEKVQAVVDNNSFVFWMNLFTGTASGIVLLAVCLKKRALPVLSDGFGNFICGFQRNGIFASVDCCGNGHPRIRSISVYYRRLGSFKCGMWENIVWRKADSSGIYWCVNCFFCYIFIFSVAFIKIRKR